MTTRPSRLARSGATAPSTGVQRSVEPELVRSLWHHLEPIHAVAYFCNESVEASSTLGLRGFWMGYFANRAAPLGAVDPGVVEATFFNFHPDRVRRAIPDAWSYADPASITASRAAAAASALRRLLPDGAADRLAGEVAPILCSAVAGPSGGGRPLFAANRDLILPTDPVAALWQAATTYREFRGDGHVALLLAADLGGCDAHVLLAADRGIAPDLFLQSRGWTAEDWRGAEDRLSARGLIEEDGTLTSAGRHLRDDIEYRTDILSAAPARVLGEDQVRTLIGLLAPAVTQIARSGSIPFPNPIGLPGPADPATGTG